MHQLFLFAFEQPVNRDARPLGNNRGNIRLRHLLLQHLFVLLDFGQMLIFIGQLLFKLGDAAVADLRHLAQITLALGLLLLHPGMVDARLDAADFLDDLFLQGPMALHAFQLLIDVGQFCFKLLQPLPGSGILFLFQGHPLNLKLDAMPFHLINLGGHAVDFNAQPGGRLVNEVNGLVRQKPVGDIPFRQGHGGNGGRVLDAHAMVHLVFFLDAAQDGDGILDGRLLHQHLLKTALQGRVLFDLAVFVQRGGADAVQLAPGQGGFEHVGGVHGPFGRPGADQGVNLVDKENDLALPFFHLLQHRLQPVLELAPVLGAGDQGSHVQGHDLLVAQGLRDVAGHDALGQTLDNGGFPHPRFADEHRVVLGAPAQHLHHPPHLVIPADHRVKLAPLGKIGEIAGIFFQGLIFFLRVRVRDPLVAPDTGQGLEKAFLAHAMGLEQLRPLAAPLIQDAEEKMFLADILILHAGRLFKGLIKQQTHPLGGIDLAEAGTAHLGQFFQQIINLGGQPGRACPHLLQRRDNHPVRLLQQHGEQMLRLHFLMALLAGKGLGRLQGFLGFHRKFIKLHIVSPETGSPVHINFTKTLNGGARKKRKKKAWAA